MARITDDTAYPEKATIGDDDEYLLIDIATGNLAKIKGSNLKSILGGGVSDGDKGDITVASSGAAFSINNGAVVAAKIGDGEVTLDKLGSDVPSAASSDPSIVPIITAAGTSTFDFTKLIDDDTAALTANATLALGNRNQLLLAAAASDLVLTCPQNSEVAFPVGSRVEVINVLAVSLTIAAGTGATLASGPWAPVVKAGGRVVITKTSTNGWHVSGDLVRAISRVQFDYSTGETSTPATAANLAAAPTPGNTLLLFVKAGNVALSDLDTAPYDGWTLLAEDQVGDGNDVVWRQYAKIADGSEQDSPIPTFATGSPAGIQTFYEEWAGLAPLEYLADPNNVLIGDGGESNETAWDPASVDTDQANTLFIARVATNFNSNGGVVSNWAGATGTQNTDDTLAGHFITYTGESWDTAVSWTTARRLGGLILPLRGAKT